MSRRRDGRKNLGLLREGLEALRTLGAERVLGDASRPRAARP